jgi:hypothetical protein
MAVDQQQRNNGKSLRSSERHLDLVVCRVIREDIEGVI